MIVRCRGPLRRRMARSTTLPIHELGEFPFVNILVTGFACEVREVEFHLPPLTLTMAIGTDRGDMAPGKPESRRIMPSDGECRRHVSPFGVARRAIVRVSRRKLTVVPVLMAIGAFGMREIERLIELSRTLIAMTVHALDLGVPTNQGITRNIVIEGTDGRFGPTRRVVARRASFCREPCTVRSGMAGSAIYKRLGAKVDP